MFQNFQLCSGNWNPLRGCKFERRLAKVREEKRGFAELKRASRKSGGKARPSGGEGETPSLTKPRLAQELLEGLLQCARRRIDQRRFVLEDFAD